MLAKELLCPLIFDSSWSGYRISSSIVSSRARRLGLNLPEIIVAGRREGVEKVRGERTGRRENLMKFRDGGGRSLKASASNTAGLAAVRNGAVNGERRRPPQRGSARIREPRESAATAA